jgi:hypothetical protein
MNARNHVATLMMNFILHKIIYLLNSMLLKILKQIQLNPINWNSNFGCYKDGENEEENKTIHAWTCVKELSVYIHSSF